MNPNAPPPRPFWQEFLRVFGIVTVAVLLLSLIFGWHQVSNFFFISTIVLLIIAIIPVFGDVGSSAKVIREMKKKGVPVKDEDVAALSQHRQNTRNTYLYGLLAFLTFVISILTISLGQ